MPKYRAYPMNHLGRIAEPPQILNCADDVAAIERTEQLVNGSEVELWDGPRLIKVFEPRSASASP